MKCEFCHKNPATLHFKQVFEGGVRELHVCQQCAEEHGLDLQSPISLTDFLFGMAAQMSKSESVVEKRCPACKMRLSDYRHTSRLGCATCYETFAAELSHLIAGMQEGTRHVGKVPVSQRTAAKIAGLRRELEKAVAEQNFEEAARLRDKIRELAAERGTEGHAAGRTQSGC